MGGIFSKNRRLCVFPKKVTFYKARGKKTQGTARISHDASTWTGENHFHSARIGRTPKGLQASAEELESDTAEGESAVQAKWDEGKRAAPVHAQHAKAPFTVTAEDAQGVEVPQEPEAKPCTEVMQHREPVGERKQESCSARKSLRETGKTPAAVHPAGGCMPDMQVSQEDNEVGPVTQTTVRAEVHVSAEVQGGPCKVQPATGIPLESGMLTLAEEATVKCVSEDMYVEKPHQDVSVQKAAESPAAPCTMEESEESELPLKTTETREGAMDLQNSAEAQTVEERDSCATTAPSDLQVERDTEDPTKNMEENSLEPEQAEEMTEITDRQTSQEIPSCLTGIQPALQDEEEIKAGTKGKPPCCRDCNRALKEHETWCSKHAAD